MSKGYLIPYEGIHGGLRKWLNLQTCLIVNTLAFYDQAVGLPLRGEIVFLLISFLLSPFQRMNFLQGERFRKVRCRCLLISRNEMVK